MLKKKNNPYITGVQFLRTLAKHNIPISCLAAKLNVHMAKIKSLANIKQVPQFYIDALREHYHISLCEPA